MQQTLEARPHSTTPTSVRRAVIAMYVGIACSIALAVATLIDQTVVGGITDEMWQAYPDYTADEVRTEETATAAYLFATAGLGVVCWLWMIRAAHRAHRGARWVASTICFVAVCLAATNGSIPMPEFLISAAWLPCLAGLVAVALLWTRESRAHFTRAAAE